MDDESWENWPFHHMELGLDDDYFSRHYCHTEHDTFLSCGSDESQRQTSVSCIVPNKSTDGYGEEGEGEGGGVPNPKRGTFILSFDSSTVIPTDEDSSPTRKSNVEGQRGKKSRSDSQALEHIMAERKRRQELTHNFIQLSATIPGLKKRDKGSILVEAINYVKRLQEQVRELEKRNDGDSIVLVNKYSDSEEECCCTVTRTELFPHVEARMLPLEKEVLIEIHCHKQNAIHLKLLEHLQNLHLRVTATTVLPFGTSTLGITIIAKMGDAYRMTLKELATNIKQLLLKSRDSL